MESLNLSQTENTIVKLIQAFLKGKIKKGEDVKPLFIANAIIKKVEFDKPFTNKIYQEELINSFRFFVDSLKSNMNDELSKLREDEKLLANFINGQITACDKMENFLNKL